MPVEPAELWAFYVAAATVAVILVVTAGAAVIVAQVKITAATRDYAARQVAALEEERGRVARELHDDVSQQIAVLSQQIDRIYESLQETGADRALPVSAETFVDGLRNLADSVRTLAHGMHPSALDHLGLGAALQGLVQESAMGTMLQIEADIMEPISEPAPHHALTLYRVAQEALRNVRKHADATQAWLRITQNGAGTTLEISDNGNGFIPDAGVASDGLGLISMRERLRLAGGELSVSSAPGHGTVVRAWVPTPPGKEA